MLSVESIQLTLQLKKKKIQGDNTTQIQPITNPYQSPNTTLMFPCKNGVTETLATTQRE